MNTRLYKQQGFTLVSTIFVIVVLSILGSFITVLAMVQHTTSAQSLEGIRAYYAAYSGLEWAVYEATTTQDTRAIICPTTSVPGGLPAAQTSPNAVSVEGFSIDVDCYAVTQVNEGANNYYVDTLTITASKGTIGNPDYITRKIVATVSYKDQMTCAGSCP